MTNVWVLKDNKDAKMSNKLISMAHTPWMAGLVGWLVVVVENADKLEWKWHLYNHQKDVTPNVVAVDEQLGRRIAYTFTRTYG